MLVVVFDFDDTLFATTHTQEIRNNWDLLETLDFKRLGEIIIDTIHLTQKYTSEIFIITNAEINWVKSCVEKYIPHCEEVLKSVKIISTVDEGFSKNKDVNTWKITAFENNLSSYFKEGVHHLVSFGDSEYDRLASLHIKEQFPNVYVKNLKLQSKPSLEELIKQHEAIHKVFRDLCEYQGHYDILVSVERYNPNNKCMKEGFCSYLL
jgi:hypothetical protein